MISYLILLHLGLIALYGLYRWQLHDLPSYRLNRFFLLIIPLICFLLPLFRLPVSPVVNKEWLEIRDEYWEPLQQGLEAQSTDAGSVELDPAKWLLLVYAAGMLWQLSLSGFGWFRACRYLRRASQVRRGNIHWSGRIRQSCAFFGHVYLGQDYQALSLRERLFLLRHEAAHARLGHSWDLLWVDFFRIVAWCNPCAHRLLKSLRSVHEFQADRAAAPAPGDFSPYARLLLALLGKMEHLPIPSFHSHPLAKRILMLKRTNSQAPVRWRAYLLSIPLLAMLLGLSAFRAGFGQSVPLQELSDKQAHNFPQLDPDDKRLPTFRPVPGEITFGFGMRMHPVLQVRKQHLGVDFTAGMNTAVRAAGSGTVVSYLNQQGYGNLLTIDHGNGYQTRYAQLSESKAEVGQIVQQGEVVALSGNTGLSTHPHLHFEVIFQGEHVDPATLLK